MNNHEQQIELLSLALRAGLTDAEICYYATDLQDVQIFDLTEAVEILIKEYKCRFHRDFPSTLEIRAAAGKHYIKEHIYMPTEGRAKSRLDAMLKATFAAIGGSYDVL